MTVSKIHLKTYRITTFDEIILSLLICIIFLFFIEKNIKFNIQILRNIDKHSTFVVNLVSVITRHD